ncbi:MAG TPA: hypothetical protein VNO30_46355 [Kofleriaceae bacterium]|nr:hypothetical protein [Kofleriaceae bacterium]
MSPPAAPAAAATGDPRLDRLYTLLPAIIRMRDAERGYPLKALCQIIAEQVNVVEDDIAQLYENWFIETAEDWAVPYIGELVGYRPVAEAGSPGSPDAAPGRVLIPRREVANLIAFRRRKGTLALLERLAADVAGWPARAVEHFKLLGWTQHVNHLHLDRHRTADLRQGEALELIDGPFDVLAHTVDVRRIGSRHTRGRYNIPSVGAFVWRLKSYSVTAMPAHCEEEAGPHCFTFSVLGQDTPLYVRPAPETDPTHIAEELNLPVPIRRRALDRRPRDYYGVDRSLAIWAEGWAGYPADRPVPAEALVTADLSSWRYAPLPGHIAVDPVLGRLVFPRGQLPKKGLRVSYHYGFAADLGGGEYPRPLIQPRGEVALYRVGEHEPYRRIGDALRRWKQDRPQRAVIELAASGVYVEPLNIHVGAGQSLQIRAADRARAVIRIIDWQTDLPDALAISMAPGSRLTLDGLLVTGRPVQITGSRHEGNGEGNGDRGAVCAAELVIRHCTLVPGWDIDCRCEPRRPAEPSLELTNLRARVRIEHSIVGSIQVHEDEVRIDPIPLSISDSIIDATDGARQAIGTPAAAWAHVLLTIRRSTVFGIVDVHAIDLAENSIFSNCVNVARRQIGCMRFCYVPPGCRTPRRYRCQPDGVIEAVKERETDPDQQAAARAGELLRVRPRFGSTRYGKPTYAQLGPDCAPEIVRGADDESEMGAFHDLFQPQREANLRARLDEYTPASMDVDLVIESGSISEPRSPR